MNYKKKIKRKIIKLMSSNEVGKKMAVKMLIWQLYQKALPQTVVEAVENGTKSKEEAVEYCIRKWPELAHIVQEIIDKLFCSAPLFHGMDEAQKKRYKTDMLFCRFAYGFLADEYVTYRLDLKNAEERRSFISEREHMHYYYLMNDIQEADTFNDKMKTYSFFRKYYGREVVAIEKADDYEIFHEFVSKHPIFVKKEVYESCGNSIAKINMSECELSEKALFESLISRGKTVLEECVVQHPVTEVFNTSSVNTVRIITFNTKHGVVAPYAFMKIGRAGSFVDNGGAGGIFVSIDEKTGVLNSSGIDEIHRVFDVHPDSGMAFSGYQLPEWDKAVALCKEMAALAPKVRYIGWDLAYTNECKWIVIEGNGMSQFIGPQSTWQRGIKAEVLDLMADMGIKV